MYEIPYILLTILYHIGTQYIYKKMKYAHRKLTYIFLLRGG